MEFNPNDIGVDNGHIYGLPFGYENSELVILPVPWDVTVSYGGGTSLAPEKVLDASLQVDLYDADYKNFWQKGIYMAEISEEILKLSKMRRVQAGEIIKLLESGADPTKNTTIKNNISLVNDSCEELRKWVFEQTQKFLHDGKKVVLLGGDHSTPLGHIQALNIQYPDMGILQIDAHCDLREAYEGFTYSHASVMYNVLQSTGVKKLVQVGIRDFCEEELQLAQNDARIDIFFDRDIHYQMYGGKTWKAICEEICNKLPNQVYISFDIDGLFPSLCPGTGTPVAGGMEVDQVFYLFNLIKASGRKIVGFDLNEVGNSEWDGNVGARVLYRLCGLMLS